MIKEKVDVLYFVEHIAREMDVACLFLLYMQKQNPDAKIVIASGLYNMADTVERYSPKMAITPYSYDRDSYLNKYLLPAYGDSVHYVNLSYEQICADANIRYKVPQDLFSKHCVQHIVWSEWFAQRMIETGTDRENIYVNGNPNFNLLFPPFNKVGPSRSLLAQEFSIDPNKQWLFIPGNFGPAFWTDDTKNKKRREGFPETFIQNQQRFSQNTFKTILEWIEKNDLGAKFEIILRPRPVVKQETYETFAKQYIDLEKVHIIKPYSVKDWIFASDIVVSNFSTSLINAAIAQKPIALLAPYAIDEERRSQWHDYVQHIKTDNDFVYFLDNVSDTRHQPLLKWAGDYIKPNSIEKLAERCNELLSRSPKSIDTDILEPMSVMKNPRRDKDQDFFTDEDVQQHLNKWRYELF